MKSLKLSILLLVLGNFSYGRFVEKLFGVEKDRKISAAHLADSIDFGYFPTLGI